MYKHILASTSYLSTLSYLIVDDFPENNTTSVLAEGLAEARDAYGIRCACILFVGQPNKYIMFDQRWLEYELLEKHEVHVTGQTLAKFAVSVAICPST
ncbi:hypothetical protein M405DRAFT_834030 [Rhizopogon salebrosus TDB-379]|nr:hypothetical protein M405DRAFT_834030 [Rhizopogon salebrosus TDB-379]